MYYGGYIWILNLKEEVGEIILSFNCYHLGKKVFEFHD